ncbi:MAG TPA: RecX family transcriptional regulator [Solirubrobacteraceae bacterium]|nr:RecX family transcriptional regulator [Solirubrobacteraceae bacterium]
MNLEAAKALAYSYLSRRERTTQEMRQHLLARGVDEPLAATVLSELAEEGYLDDQRFARLFTEDRRALSGWGSERIRRALIGRGIAPSVAESALQADLGGQVQADLGGQELERALVVLRRRFPSPPVTSRDRGRALGVLMRKGYEYEVAVDALAEHARRRPDAIAPPPPRY